MDQRLAAVLYLAMAAAYMALVARSHFHGVRAGKVAAMALGWVLIFAALTWLAAVMGWRER